MNTVTELYDRPVRVELSEAAASVCAKRGKPLLVEMELLIGCLVTKRAHFHEVTSDTYGVEIDPCLYLDFRLTVSGTCEPDGEGCGNTPNRDSRKNIHPYVPSWCRIDYTGGQWSCEFGYDRNQH